jgi:outer membrane lipoprotein-sorting protein
MTNWIRFRLAVCSTALCAALAPVPGRAEDAAARALVQKVRDTAPKTPFAAKAKLTSDRGFVRELDLKHKHLNDVEASLMEVTAPMDLKDTRFLLLDRETGQDEQYIYSPAARRAVRVGTQTRKQDFLGTEFAVGDLVQPEVDDATYRFVGEEDVGGRKCTLVEATPKDTEDAMYSKTIAAIDPTDLLVMRTQLFDDKGALYKVWTMVKAEKIDGVWTPVLQRMEDVQGKHWSEIELSEVKYNADVPDDTFSRQNLTK